MLNAPGDFLIFNRGRGGRRLTLETKRPREKKSLNTQEHDNMAELKRAVCSQRQKKKKCHEAVRSITAGEKRPCHRLKLGDREVSLESLKRVIYFSVINFSPPEEALF